MEVGRGFLGGRLQCGSHLLRRGGCPHPRHQPLPAPPSRHLVVATVAAAVPAAAESGGGQPLRGSLQLAFRCGLQREARLGARLLLPGGADAGGGLRAAFRHAVGRGADAALLHRPPEELRGSRLAPAGARLAVAGGGSRVRGPPLDGGRGPRHLHPVRRSAQLRLDHLDRDPLPHHPAAVGQAPAFRHLLLHPLRPAPRSHRRCRPSAQTTRRGRCGAERGGDGVAAGGGGQGRGGAAAGARADGGADAGAHGAGLHLLLLDALLHQRQLARRRHQRHRTGAAGGAPLLPAAAYLDHHAGRRAGPGGLGGGSTPLLALLPTQVPAAGRGGHVCGACRLQGPAG